MASSSQVQAQVPLKDRIAALQQKPNASSTHPSAAPARSGALSPTGQPTSPPRGTLRDKISKFERKGGVPVPRGSFGMGAPPPQDAGSNKSRELYGNRIPGPDRKPGASPPPNPRSVTAPSSFPRGTSPAVDGLPAAAEPLSPNITGESVAATAAAAAAVAPALSRSNSMSGEPKTRRRLSVAEMIGQYNVLDGAPSRRSSQIISASSSSVALPAANGDAPEPPASAPASVSTASSSTVEGGADDGSALPTPPPSATAESQEQPRRPPPLERAFSSASSVHTAEILSGTRTAIVPAESKPTLAPAPVPKVDAAPAPVSKGKAAAPASAKLAASAAAGKSVPAPIHVPETPSTPSEPSLTPVPAPTKSFTVVVHAKTSDDHRRASTEHAQHQHMPPPPASASAGASDSRRSGSGSGSQDGHTLSRIRSKRQFKHLAAAPEPPASPAAPELSDLLQDAAWFEATLGSAFDIPSVTFDTAAPDVSLALPTSTSASAATSTKSAPTTAPATSTSSSSSSSSPPPRLAPLGTGFGRTASTSTPTLSTLKADASDAPPTPPPKSARTRRFFSLRARGNAGRTSVSSERSSDDSAPIATPPSPPPTHAHAQGQGQGQAETRSMLSIKSVASGATTGTSGGSLRLSPHRGIARAATFAERMFSRAGKTKSVVDDLPAPIPEQSFQLPPPVPGRAGSGMGTLDIGDLGVSSSASSPAAISFDFDAFPSVPQDTPAGARHARAVTDYR